MDARSAYDSRTLRKAIRIFHSMPKQPALADLYAEGHDGVDDVVVVLLESLDGLLP